MANTTKKYYWLKLNEGFFRDKKIKKLRRIAGGDTYTVIYLKMQLLSLKTDGKLFFEGVEDNFVEEIALEIDEEVDNVKVTVAFLMNNGLLEEVEEDSYILPQTIESIGSESSSAERVRRHRAKKNQALPAPDGKALQCNTDVTNGNTEIELEQEKEKRDKDREELTDRQTDRQKDNVLNVSKKSPREIEQEQEKRDRAKDKEIELTDRQRERVELLRDLFAGWSVNDNQIFYISSLINDRLPYTYGISERDLKIYDNLDRLIKKAKADSVKHIYRWLEKVIPEVEIY